MSRPDGNGNWDDPPAGDGLPDLPAEWGHIVVPDDASALHREAEQIRRELRDGRSGPAESGSRSNVSSPVSPSDEADSPSANCSGRTPIPTRLERWMRS